MSFVDDNGTGLSPRRMDVAGAVSGGAIALGALAMGVEQALVSGPVWTPLEGVVVVLAAVVAVIWTSFAYTCARRLDNRGGAR